MATDIFDWRPNVGVGKIQLGEPIAPLVESGFLIHCEDRLDVGGAGCFTHGEEEEPAAYVDENGFVETIICIDELNFRGRNLIDMEFEDVIAVLGREPDQFGEEIELGEDNVQITAEFDSLGLQLWLRDGVVVSAGVYVAIEDDD